MGSLAGVIDPVQGRRPPHGGSLFALIEFHQPRVPPTIDTLGRDARVSTPREKRKGKEARVLGSKPSARVENFFSSESVPDHRKVLYLGLLRSPRKPRGVSPWRGWVGDL